MSHFLLFADYEELESKIAVGIASFYALLIVVALLFKAFRSWIGLVAAFLFSAMASLPAASAVSQVLKYPSHLNRQSVTGNMQAVAMILIFVWAAPIIQYLIIRPKRRRQSIECLISRETP